MIAVLWAELADWSASGRRGLWTAILCVSLTGGLTGLRPEICGTALTFIVLWRAAMMGMGRANGIQSWEWVMRARLAPIRVVMGRLSAALLLALAHLFAALPAGTLMVLLWGVSWPALGGMVLLTWIGASIAAGLGLICGHLNIEDEPYLAQLLLSGWLVITALIPWLRIANPLLQVWACLTGPGWHISHGLFLGLGLGLGVALLATFLLRLEVERKQ